jgi:MFS family permease
VTVLRTAARSHRPRCGSRADRDVDEERGVDTAQRTNLSLLRDRDYGPFYAGKVLSNSGVWMQNLAAAVLMFQLTGSAFMVGMVSAFQFTPAFVLALPSGALSDRFDRRRLLMVGRLISGVAVTALGALVLADGAASTRPGVLLTAILIAGIGWTLSQPAMMALVPNLVPKEDLEAALALSSSVPSIGRTAGPVIGAGLLVVGGPGLALLVAGTFHLTFAAMLTRVVVRDRVRGNGRPGLLGGLRHLITDDPRAGVLMLGVIVLGLGSDPAITLAPSLADDLGGGDGLVGVLVAMFGVGAILLSVGFRRLRRHVSLRGGSMLGFVLLSAGLVIVASTGSVAVVQFGFLVQGAGFMLVMVALNTRLQQRVPELLRGRVMAVWGMAFLGLRPVAALVDGALADLVGVRSAMLIVAVATLLGVVFARVDDPQDRVRP